LAARQRQLLGSLSASVRWYRRDLARQTPQRVPFAAQGLIVANEVFDCLPHYKIVSRPNASPGVVHVVAERAGKVLDRADLAPLMVRRRRPLIRFREIALPLAASSQLGTFLRRHYPERCAPGAAHPAYFAAPRIETLIRHAFRLYERAEALWVDYGAQRSFHLRAPESRRIFAGPPRSGAGLYDDPGRHDITFLVDFSVAATAAREAGWTVVYCGPQRELARRSGIKLDRSAVETIVQHRVLGWMLAVVGVGPERAWRHTAVSWSRSANGHVPIRRYVEQAVREFLSPRSAFKLLITRK
jgi:SAM-dependent MidA family methyltransferase